MADFRDGGFAVADLQLSEPQCDHVALSIPPWNGGRKRVRGLLTHPTVLQFLRHQKIGRYLWSVVGRNLVAVDATLADNTADAGTPAPWHQDRVIAVRERLSVDGFRSWTVKAGVTFVEPPSHVLEQMLSVRVYLDDAGSESAQLRVIPGSHESGRVEDEEIDAIASAGNALDVSLSRGSIVVMRPLLLHASPFASAPAHRRVLQIEFAPAESIWPLQWEHSVPLRWAA